MRCISFKGHSHQLPLANTIIPQSLPLHFFAVPAGVIFVLAVCGVNNELIGSLALVGCLLLILTKAGMEFSADHRAVREYYSLFGWRFGRWQSLPPIVGVTVKYFSEIVSPTPGRYSWGIWNDAPRHYAKLVVLLSVKNNPVGMVVGNFSLNEATEALDFARVMAEGFAVPVHTFLPDEQFNAL